MIKAFPFEWATAFWIETSWMRLKFSALLGCHLREKGLSMTNPVYFVPVYGGENLAWHQMPLSNCFPKQRPKKWTLPPLLSFFSSLLLDKHIESVSSFIYLSRAWFVCDPVAIVAAPVRCRTCVCCIYYGMLRKERADWSAGALWCHTQVCDCFFLFFLLVLGSCLLLFSGESWEQEAI